jgi:hypothetical protein
MKKTLQTVAFLMATLSMLTACLPEGQPDDSATTTTTAAPESEQEVSIIPPDPAGLKQMMLSAENVVLEYNSIVYSGSQTREVTLKRAGGMIEIVEKTSKKEGNLIRHTKSTTYYDLDNNDIYRHDKDGNFYVYKMDEPFDWQSTLSSYGFMMSAFGPVFKNDTYIWIEGGKYVATEDVLKEQSERKGRTYKSMTLTIGSTRSSASCTMEDRSGSMSVSFHKPKITFPDAYRLT